MTENVQSVPAVPGGWNLMFRRLLRFTLMSLLTGQANPTKICAQTTAAPPLTGVIGNLQSLSASSLDIMTGSAGRL